MAPDPGDRDPARAGAESRAAKAGAADTVPARGVPVFVRAAEKKQRIRWEFPVMT